MDMEDGMIPEIFERERVQWYLGFLEEYNERGGFFSRGDSERILERHVMESAMFVSRVLDYVPVSRETTVLDAGSGPGLPGFLFACLPSPPGLTLNDSSRRRLSILAAALGQSNGADLESKGSGTSRFSSPSGSSRNPGFSPGADGVPKSHQGSSAHPSRAQDQDKEHKELAEPSKSGQGLTEPSVTSPPPFPDIQFSYQRLEEMKGRFHLIVSRALIPFPSVLRLIAHLQKPEDVYAGFFSPLEVFQYQHVIDDCGYRLEKSEAISTPSGAERQILFFRKEKTVRQGKPFAWKFIRGEMSQWQKS